MTESLETYLIFVALQCVSVPLALFLSPPEKVQRSDGTKVKIVVEKSFVAELRELRKAVSRRDVLSRLSHSVNGLLMFEIDYLVVACILGSLLQPVHQQ